MEDKWEEVRSVLLRNVPFGLDTKDCIGLQEACGLKTWKRQLSMFFPAFFNLFERLQKCILRFSPFSGIQIE